MPPLTWRNVDTPDFSSGNQLLAKSGDTLAASIAGIGGAMQHYRAGQVDDWSKTAQANAQKYTDLASLDAAIKDGSIYGGRAPGDVDGNTMAFISAQRNALQDQANKEEAFRIANQRSSGGGGGGRRSSGDDGGYDTFIPPQDDGHGGIVDGTGITVHVPGNGGGGSSGNSSGSGGRGNSNQHNYAGEAWVAQQTADLDRQAAAIDPTAPGAADQLAQIDAARKQVSNYAVGIGNAAGVTGVENARTAADASRRASEKEADQNVANQDFFDRIYGTDRSGNGLTLAQAQEAVRSMSPADQKLYGPALKLDPTLFGHPAWLPPEAVVPFDGASGADIADALSAKEAANKKGTDQVPRSSPGSVLGNLAYNFGDGTSESSRQGEGAGTVNELNTGATLGFYGKYAGSPNAADPSTTGGAPIALADRGSMRPLSFGSNAPVLATDEQHNQDVANLSTKDYGIDPGSAYNPAAIDERVNDQHILATQVLEADPYTKMEAFKAGIGAKDKEGAIGPGTQEVAKAVYDKLSMSTDYGWSPPDVEQTIRDIAKKYDVSFNDAASAIAASASFQQNNLLPGFTGNATSLGDKAGDVLKDFFTNPMSNFVDFNNVKSLLTGYNDSQNITDRAHIKAGMGEVTKEYNTLVTSAKKAGDTLEKAQRAFDLDPTTNHSAALAAAYKTASGLQDKISQYDYAGKLAARANPKKAAEDAAKADALERAKSDASVNPTTGQKLGSYEIMARDIAANNKRKEQAVNVPLTGPSGRNLDPSQDYVSGDGPLLSTRPTGPNSILPLNNDGTSTPRLSTPRPPTPRIEPGTILRQPGQQNDTPLPVISSPMARRTGNEPAQAAAAQAQAAAQAANQPQPVPGQTLRNLITGIVPPNPIGVDNARRLRSQFQIQQPVVMDATSKDFSVKNKVVGDILNQPARMISLPEYMKLTPSQRASKKLPVNFHGSAQEWRAIVAGMK